MLTTPQKPPDSLEELRALILRRDREQVGELKDRLDNKERRVRDVSGVLPQAITLSRERGGGAELTRALQPSVESSIRTSLEERPEMFVEVLHPIIGSLVRRSITESLRGLIQSLNKTLEHTFSWQGIKWRYEAFRTGKSFAEVVILRSMIYRVEELFLVHRETSLTLLHASADDTTGSDSDLVAGMLSAIRDFARDALKAGADDSLDEFRIGDLQGWIASGRNAYLAAAIRGTPPRELRVTLEECIENIHVLKGGELARFDGDAAVFESLRPELESCLREQYRREATPGEVRRNTTAWIALSVATALVLSAAVLAGTAQSRWSDFLRRLDAEPGVAVTSAHRAWWWGRSSVAGLRDPLAAGAGPLAQAAGVRPDTVDYSWKSYLALDPVSVQRRFEQRFPIAPDAGTRVAVRDGGVVELAGAAPYEWVERVRREGTEVPGVTRILTDTGLIPTYDPTLARARFVAAYPPPSTITAQMEADGTLALSGTAPYEWVAAAREGATRLAGIKTVSETGLNVVFAPERVLGRFTERFGVPDTVNATVRDGVLVLGGEASHAWLTRAREGATQVAGITSLDEKALVDLDQQAFQQSKAVIESAYVYFLVNKDNFATEGFAALSRLPDVIRRCETTGRHLGMSIDIQILGSADSTGLEAKNLDLSRRRAGAVRDFLISCGLDAALFQVVGTGAPPLALPLVGVVGKPAGEESQRRVAFHVGTRITSPP